ncbi:MAG: anti-sigma factor [Flavobacteriales bacterium]|jgi:anti-sigma-K factor RskA|nr:anti-sigma factor [Flavobacteriales bacterium]
MNEQEIIESGILEVYVSGALSSDETIEIEEAIAASPILQSEIEKIEASLITLAKAVAPPLSAMVWSYILASIQKVRTLDTKSDRTNWAAITGWAAAILCIGGIFWMLTQNNELRETIQITSTENQVLESDLENTEAQLAETTELLEIVRSKEYSAYTLSGNQAVAPEAFAKVYFNKNDKVAYIDAKGLPEAPEGKVYQVWSLIMEPLTPSSVGLLEGGTEVENGIYKFDNIPDPEAFGITLEPAGGSESPTLSQLYTLGSVSAAP